MSQSGQPSSSEWMDRVALVTGGTSGTGFETAARLLRAGASVAINGRSETRGAEAVSALRDISPEVYFCPGECSDYGAASGVVEAAADRFGGIDTVVSAGAAGEGGPKPFSEMTPEEIKHGFESRYLARLYPVHAAVTHLRESNAGSVVLLTTDAGRHTTVGESVMGAYAASIIQMTKALAREMSRDQIRVNAVSMTLTSGTQSWDEIFATDSFQKALFEKAVARFPFGAAPTAGDVADAVVFLAGPRASQVSGQTLSVNGGLSFGGW